MGRVPFQIFTGINGLAALDVIKDSFGYAEGASPSLPKAALEKVIEEE